MQIRWHIWLRSNAQITCGVCSWYLSHKLYINKLAHTLTEARRNALEIGKILLLFCGAVRCKCYYWVNSHTHTRRWFQFIWKNIGYTTKWTHNLLLIYVVYAHLHSLFYSYLLFVTEGWLDRCLCVSVTVRSIPFWFRIETSTSTLLCPLFLRIRCVLTHALYTTR